MHPLSEEKALRLDRAVLYFKDSFQFTLKTAVPAVFSVGEDRE